MKRFVPLLIMFVVGTVMIVAYFVPKIEYIKEDASIWFDILAAIAFVLGGGNLLRIHSSKVFGQKEGWGYSAITLISFGIVLTVGLAKVGVSPAVVFPDSTAWTGDFNEAGSAFNTIYMYVFKPCQAAMFAMLAFYVASAAFRAFRAKNIDATLLLGTAFLILLGRTFVGTWLTSWMPESLEQFTIPNMTNWVMTYMVTAGNRAIMIGIALGVASTSLKVILGIDRSYLGQD